MVYTRLGAARCPEGTQCHAALGTMPYTLASMDQSHVCRPRTLPPPRRGSLGLDFGDNSLHSGLCKIRFKLLKYYVLIFETYVVPRKAVFCSSALECLTMMISK
jgi:hypothetical protein